MCNLQISIYMSTSIAVVLPCNKGITVNLNEVILVQLILDSIT